MISFPNAKINLGLNVVSKRPDGYHNIETIFYPIPVKDALEIVRADTFSFTTNGNTGRCSNRKKLGCQSTESAEVTVRNPGTGSPSTESYSLRSRTWRRLGRCCLYAEVAERLLRTSYPGRQLGRTCLLHRSGLSVLYPQYAGICIRHGKYLRNGGIVAGRLPSLSSQAGCCRLDTGSLFDGDARSSGYLFERNHPETCRRMERIDDKRF